MNAETLESNWRRLVNDHEDACQKAWRIVDVPDLGDDATNEEKYFRDLISIAKTYITE